MTHGSTLHSIVSLRCERRASSDQACLIFLNVAAEKWVRCGVRGGRCRDAGGRDTRHEREETKSLKNNSPPQQGAEPHATVRSYRQPAGRPRLGTWPRGRYVRYVASNLTLFALLSAPARSQLTGQLVLGRRQERTIQAASRKAREKKMLSAVALLASSAAAFSPLPLVGSAPSSSRVSSVQMKHVEYFTRVQNAEAGRLRLCVSR